MCTFVKDSPCNTAVDASVSSLCTLSNCTKRYHVTQHSEEVHTASKNTLRSFQSHTCPSLSSVRSLSLWDHPLCPVLPAVSSPSLRAWWPLLSSQQEVVGGGCGLALTRPLSASQSRRLMRWRWWEDCRPETMISGQLHNTVLWTDFGWKGWKNSEAGNAMMQPCSWATWHSMQNGRPSPTWGTGNVHICIQRGKLNREQNATGPELVFFKQTKTDQSISVSQCYPPLVTSMSNFFSTLLVLLYQGAIVYNNWLFVLWWALILSWIFIFLISFVPVWAQVKCIPQ